MAQTDDETGTLQFLPTNLNRQPVVIGGLTADEMWITISLCGVSGLVMGIPIAIMAGNAAFVLAGGIVGGVLGLTVASRILRRLKRNRPDTWFYRQVQLNLAMRAPFLGDSKLITRAGAWSCHRTLEKQ